MSIIWVFGSPIALTRGQTRKVPCCVHSHTAYLVLPGGSATSSKWNVKWWELYAAVCSGKAECWQAQATWTFLLLLVTLAGKACLGEAFVFTYRALPTPSKPANMMANARCVHVSWLWANIRISLSYPGSSTVSNIPGHRFLKRS